MTANQWSPVTVGRLGAAVGVAEAALDAAREHTSMQHSAASAHSSWQLTLLASALALTFGAMMAVNRASSDRCNNMRDAMLKVASGDLTSTTGYTARRDGSVALAGALETFKAAGPGQTQDRRAERERIPAPPRSAGDRSLRRRIREHGTATLQELGDASGQMRNTSRACRRLRQTNERVHVAEKASGEASMSVESVASASEN